MCMFVAQLGAESLLYQTIKCYLSAVRHYSIVGGQGDPFAPGALPVLQYVLRGVRHRPQSPAQPRLPITPQILRCLKAQWAAHTAELNYIMLWAACCFGFLGFMRAGEFTSRPGEDFEPSSSLTPEDVSVDDHDNPSMVYIHLKCNKTDPFRHRVDIYLGRTGRDPCPVAALLAYKAVHPAVQGPLFLEVDGTPLTRDKLVTAVRQALQKAGVQSARYSGYSFRIGAATTAAQAGLEDSMVKILGRWESSAYQRYIRTPRDTLAAISVRLASQSS